MCVCRYSLSQSTTKSAVFKTNLHNILRLSQQLPAGDQISVYVQFVIEANADPHITLHAAIFRVLPSVTA